MLADLAAEHGAVTQVSHQRRSSPLLQLAYRECRARGPITHAVCEFYKCAPEAMVGARGHAGRRRARHRYVAMDVRRGGRRRREPMPTHWRSRYKLDRGHAVFRERLSGLSAEQLGERPARIPGGDARAGYRGGRRAGGHGQDCAPMATTKGNASTPKRSPGATSSSCTGGSRAKHREFIDVLRGRADRPSSPFSDTVKTMEVAETILAQALLHERPRPSMPLAGGAG